MGDAFASFLPFLPGIPFATLSAVLFYFWMSAMRELRHSQRGLDAERDSRRKVEDKMDILAREVRTLTAEVSRLRALLGQQLGDGK